jgi:hypothetical protein
MFMHPGQIFHESSTFPDPVSSRRVVRVTSSGHFNNTAGYHFNTAFSADSRYAVVKTRRSDGTALLRFDISTGELCVIACAEPASPLDYYAASHSVVAKANALVTTVGGGIRMYDLETFEETPLLRPLGVEYEMGQPMGSIDGKYIYYTVMPVHPEVIAGRIPANEGYWAPFVNGRSFILYRLELASGRVDEVLHDPICGCWHIQPSPVEPDWWLIEFDRPPLYSWQSDYGRTSRCWLVNVSTLERRELRPLNDMRFQSHSNWSPDGQYVYYHARDRQTGYPMGHDGGGHYIGAVHISGRVVWERIFPHWYYGHVSSHAAKNAILLDSLITPDLIVQVNFELVSSVDCVPPLEILGRHSSQVLYGKQHTHPHLQTSPDGRWVYYNRFDGVRSDVYLLEIL